MIIKEQINISFTIIKIVRLDFSVFSVGEVPELKHVSSILGVNMYQKRNLSSTFIITEACFDFLSIFTP